MNILFILKDFSSCGGVQSITKIIAESLVDKGFNVTIVSCSKISDRYSKSDSLTTISLPSSIIMNKTNVVFFKSLLKKHNIDIIINQGVYRDVTAFLHVALKGIKMHKVISVVHSDPLGEIKDINYKISQKGFKSLLKRSFQPIYKKWIKHLYARRLKTAESFSSVFVLLSAAFMNDFKTIYPKINKPIYIIPNTVNFKNISIDDNLLNKKEKTIIYVGRITESHKRISRLLYIWNKIWYKYPDWKLELIGDGDDFVYNTNLAKQMKMQNIFFLGKKENVVPYLEKASILCLVSESEGFSMSILEGMYFGVVPIAYASFSSIHDFIINEINGFAITPYNEEEYISNLEVLIKNADLRMKLAKEARNTTNLFSIETITSKWVNLFSILQDTI